MTNPTNRSPSPSLDASETDLAYVAGYLDGEGCFFCYKGRIGIACENTYRPTIEWLHKLFGGSLTVSTHKRRSNHRTTYRWAVVSRDAFACCQRITPFLKEKTEQALLLISLQYLITKGGKKIPENIQMERERLAKRLKELKHAWS